MAALSLLVLVLAPLCRALSPQPLGLTLEHQRLARTAGLGGHNRLQQDGQVRNHIQEPFLQGFGAAEDRTVEEISENILQEAVEVKSNLANKFNDLSSIHFSTPQFSYVPPFLKNVVQTKKSRFDELIDLKKSTLDKLTDPSRYLKALDKIVEFKKSALDNIIHPNKATMKKIIEFKKSALGNILHPKKDLIADLVQKKREKIAEIGATFPSTLGNIIHPKKELIADLVQQKREKIAEIGASFPGSEKLRQRLFPGSERLRATLLQPFKQAYQGFRDGVREEIGSLPRPAGSPPTSSASFSPSPQGSVPWQLAGDTFRPVSAPSTSRPRIVTDIGMRAKTAGCPYAIQYCQDSVSSRLPKATAMLAEEPQEEPRKEVREQVQERVVKSSMRVVAADSPSQRRPRQGVYQQTRRPRQPTPLLRQKHQDKFVASRPSRRPKAPARLQGLPEGFRGALRIPKESTPINRAVHASSIFLNIDEFMASLRRRGLSTESLLTPNTIPIWGVDEKKTKVFRGRLKKQDESMLPRMRVLPTPIVAAEEDINDFSFVSSDQRRVDTEPFDEMLTQESSGYGDKILLDKKQDLEVSASDNVFTKDDLELVAGLVKPLVAELKAGLTTTTDRPVVEQNNNLEIDTTTATPSEPSEETTNDVSMIITDYYGSGQEKVISDYSNKIQLTDAENLDDAKDSINEILESDDSDETEVIHKLPENIAVMSLVRETPEILEEKREDLPVFMAMVQEKEVEVDKELEVQKEDEEQEEVFYLPAGHGLRFSFKRGNLGKLRPGRGLGIF